MPVTVHFRGVMLFVFEKARPSQLREILIPDCEKVPRFGRGVDKAGNQPWQHFDGSAARPHYAGMLIKRAGLSAAQRIPIRGVDFSLKSDLGDKQPDKSKWNDPDGTLLPKIDLLPKGDYASRIQLEGFHLKTMYQKDAGNRLKFGKKKDDKGKDVDVDVAPIVFGTVDKVSISMPFFSHSIDNGDVWIYNWDTKDPEIQDLEAPPDEPDAKSLVDVDFRWLYSILDVTPTDVLWRGMPTPWFAYEDGRTVSVSTCFPAYVEIESSGPVPRRATEAKRDLKTKRR